MPIRPELRKFYGRDWQRVTRPRILKRAGNRCEQCRKPNGKTVIVLRRGDWLWWRTPRSKRWRNRNGEISLAPLAPPLGEYRVRVVLTIAHLNHVSRDDRDDNLKALCQWCHLHYDQLHHKETRSARKDQSRPLLRMEVTC